MEKSTSKEKLEKALERLESAIETKISTLESENSRLKADVIKLKSELAKLTPVSASIISNPSNLTSEGASSQLKANPRPLAESGFEDEMSESLPAQNRNALNTHDDLNVKKPPQIVSEHRIGKNEQLSDVQISLAKLKRLVS